MPPSVLLIIRLSLSFLSSKLFLAVLSYIFEVSPLGTGCSRYRQSWFKGRWPVCQPTRKTMRCYLFTSSCAIAVILAVTFLGHSALVAANELSNTVVDVGVYYESLCPDSIQWIKYQLMPHYDALQNYINVTFVPYGKASHWQDTNTQQWHFTCQHGPEECNGNKAQACGIYAIENEEPTNKVQQLSVALVGCVMSSQFPPSYVPQCAQDLGLNDKALTSISKCIEGSKSNELLVSYGKTTQNLKPNLSFVPTITINGVNSQEIQNKAQNNFFKLICDTLAEGAKPSQCSTA